MKNHEIKVKVKNYNYSILIGKNTAEVDNPELTVRAVKGINPIRIIADTYRKLNLNLKIFNDKESKTIVLCSKDVFEDNSTTFCDYLPVQLNDKYLDTNDILDVLGERGITTLMVEGGKKILESFINDDLINEIYLFTSNTTINESNLLNPLKIDEKWQVLSQKDFVKD